MLGISSRKVFNGVRARLIQALEKRVVNVNEGGMSFQE